MSIWSRYCTAFASAGFVTFLLFAVMIGLIKISAQPLSGEGRFDMVNFIRVERDRSLNLDQLKPEPPPQPLAPPQQVNLQMSAMDVATQRFNLSSGPITEGFSIDSGFTPGDGGVGAGFGGGMVGGGDYLPVVQVPPQYPPSALKQGIEGWVLLEFTIGTEGQVKNARVVQAEPAGIFDQSALDAVQRFRFRPRMLGSMAVEVTGVQNRIRFRLQQR